MLDRLIFKERDFSLLFTDLEFGNYRNHVQLSDGPRTKVVCIRGNLEGECGATKISRSLERVINRGKPVTLLAEVTEGGNPVCHLLTDCKVRSFWNCYRGARFEMEVSFDDWVAAQTENVLV